MEKLKEQLNFVINTIKQRPILSGSIAFVGLSLFLLRKQHYRFVVHPNIQGRSNKTNTLEYQHPLNRGMDSEDIKISTTNNLILRGWYIKHKDPKYLIVFYHQNAGNIGTRLYFIQKLMENVPANVLIVAYRGFSDSDGQMKPNQREIVDDAKSIFIKGEQLSKRDKLPIFVLGRSLGGFSAISTLSQPVFHKSAKGLILENTFTSIYDVAANLMPKVFSFLLWTITSGSYNSAKKLPNVDIPILFVKGCRDTLIPKAQMDALQKIHSDLKKQNFEFLVERGQHNDTWYVGGINYFNRINEFLVYCSRL